MPSVTTPLSASSGRRRRGCLESEDLPVACKSRTPRGRRIRGQTAHTRTRSPVAPACHGIRSDSQGARRRKDEDALRTDVCDGERLERARRARAGRRDRRVLLPRHLHQLRAVRRPGRSLRRQRVERLGVQGRRSIAARRSRPGPVEDGDEVLWYYADFGPTGGPPTLEVKPAPGGCYLSAALDDNGKSAAVSGLQWHVGSKTTVAGTTGKPFCPKRHPGL